MNVAMMIDLETLSLQPDAFVTQIGYCIADLDTRQIIVPGVNILLTEQGQEGRRKDLSTICWWMQQAPEVRQAVYPTGNVEREHPSRVFEWMSELLAAHNVRTVWSGPGMFDLPILTHLWGRKPWKYDQERCLSTLKRTIDPAAIYAPPENKMAHDAASDAQWQMEYLIRLWGLLHSRGLLDAKLPSQLPVALPDGNAVPEVASA